MHYQHRLFHDLSGIWTICFEDSERTDKCFPVAVPASFNDQFTEDWQRNYLGKVCYKREVWVPREFQDDKTLLSFEGVNYRARIRWNGEEIGEHESSHLPFEADLTGKILWDQPNQLEVITDALLDSTTIPQGNLGNKQSDSGQITNQYPDNSFDFFPYGGIHRPVRLVSIPQAGCIIDAWVETLKIHENAAVISVFVSTDADSDCSILVDFPDYNQSVQDTAAGFRKGVTVQLSHPRLWSPESPFLGKMKVSLLDNGTPIDTLPTRFGIRTIEVSGTDILLNGKKIFLKGFGKHEDSPVAGRGLQPAWIIRDYNLMSWVGANSFRTSHYPYSETYLDLADELGFLVISETPAVSLNFGYVNGKTLDSHIDFQTRLMKRDRRHPSVIAWCLANEATAREDAAHDYFSTLLKEARKVDNSRLITWVTCLPWEDKTMELPDFLSLNIYPGWYTDPGQIPEAVARLRRILTQAIGDLDKPLLISEFGADTLAGFHANPPELWSEEYQKELILALLEEMEKHPRICGTHIWNFADFRTAQHHFRAGGNRKGVFTRDRQPKMAAHGLREVWVEKDALI